METQTERAKLMPEQLKENMRKSKANWRQNNKELLSQGRSWLQIHGTENNMCMRPYNYL